MRPPSWLGAVGGPYVALRRRWRRSLQLRIVATTLAATLVVIAFVGAFVLNRVTNGLLGAQRRAALATAKSGYEFAQADLRTLADATDPVSVDERYSLLVRQLATRGGQAGSYDVVLLRGVSDNGFASGSDSDLANTPAELRRRVAQGSSIFSAYTRVERAGGAVSAYAIGAPLDTVDGRLQLYYLFPLTEQQETLSLVRRTLLGGGAILILLITGVAALVTRQVVTPVRLAARIAEDLAGGELEARMQVRGEDELARLGEAFNDMAGSLQQKISQLQELSRVQRRFVADVSHELRTPLTTVRMAADVLHGARADFPPEVARSAELLQAELDRFEALLVDLLEISRFDAGAAMLDSEVVELGAVVRRVVQALAPLAARRGSDVQVRSAATEPVLVEADARRVERILRNLVANAVEHGEGLPIVVTLAAGEDAVAVTVRDHGVGLRPGEASRVFNRFWRADPARARGSGGTGLGLSIALEDARLHGGWLQASGAPGQGAVFRLTLPRHAGDHFLHSPLPLEPEAVNVGG